MATSSRSAERFKYGICLNDECPLCKEKKVQQIPMRKDLVCSECGKPLRECPPPRKKGVDSKLIGIIAAILIVLAGAVFGIYSSMGGTKVDKIILDKESVSLIVDKKDVIKPTVLDKDGKEIKDAKITYKWTVKDEEVASVTESGEVTALKEGNTSITVMIEGDEEHTATCQVVIKQKKIPGGDPVLVNNLSVPNSNVSLKVGEETKLNLTIEPDNYNEGIAYESSDPDIALVENNVIKAKKKGRAQITIKTETSGKSLTINVNVTNDKDPGKDGGSDGPGPQKGRYRGTLSLGYGSYSGDILNGKPDGAGVLTYRAPRKAGRNVKTGEDVNAESGERVDGTWTNGYLSSGTLFKKDGNAIKIKY